MVTATTVRDNIRYGYAVGRVRVLDGHMLSHATFERLLDAHDLQEQKRILAETHYGRYLEAVTTPSEVERALETSLSDLYDDFLERAGLPSAVVMYFRTPYNYANLRASVKSRVFGTSADGLLSTLGSLAPESFSGNGAALPGPMRDLLAMRDDAGKPLSLDDIEALIDRALFAALDEIAQQSEVRFLRDLTVLRIDCANARLFIRSRAKHLTSLEMGRRAIPGGTKALEALAGAAPRMTAQDLATAIAKTGALGQAAEVDLADTEHFDVAADALVAERMLVARRAPGGAEPVLAHVLGREAEVMLLRTAIVGMLNGVAREDIRARLRGRIR